MDQFCPMSSYREYLWQKFTLIFKQNICIFFSILPKPNCLNRLCILLVEHDTKSGSLITHAGKKSAKNFTINKKFNCKCIKNSYVVRWHDQRNEQSLTLQVNNSHSKLTSPSFNFVIILKSIQIKQPLDSNHQFQLNLWDACPFHL